MKKGQRVTSLWTKIMIQSSVVMTKPGEILQHDQDPELTPLLSDEPTIELVVRARTAIGPPWRRCSSAACRL
jgi:hypothetical protein